MDIMSKLASRRVAYAGLTGWVLLAISSICFNCAPGEHATSPGATCPKPGEHHDHHRPKPPEDGTSPPNYITCSGSFDCVNSSWFPECGDYDNVTCVAPAVGQTKQCLFRLVDQGGCFCLERDIRNCTMGSGGTGGAGIQRCVKVATDTTSWGGCGGI